MSWRVELGESAGLFVEVLQAQEAWRRLSKPARAAVLQADRGETPTCHANTLHALERHGFVVWDTDARMYRMTEAGKRVAKWNREQP